MALLSELKAFDIPDPEECMHVYVAAPRNTLTYIPIFCACPTRSQLTPPSSIAHTRMQHRNSNRTVSNDSPNKYALNPKLVRRARIKPNIYAQFRFNVKWFTHEQQQRRLDASDGRPINSILLP